jgi:hypothetical protein
LRRRARTGWASRLVEEDVDDAREQADVDAMDQDLLIPNSEDDSGSEHGRGRCTSPDIIEINRSVG